MLPPSQAGGENKRWETDKPEADQDKVLSRALRAQHTQHRWRNGHTRRWATWRCASVCGGRAPLGGIFWQEPGFVFRLWGGCLSAVTPRLIDLGSEQPFLIPGWKEPWRELSFTPGFACPSGLRAELQRAPVCPGRPQPDQHPASRAPAFTVPLLLLLQGCVSTAIPTPSTKTL